MRYISILISCFTLFIMGCSSDVESLHPSDELLIKRFEKHEAKFNELAKMTMTDSDMARIANNFLWSKKNVRWPRPESEWGISKDRWDNYRQLFKELGVKDGLLHNSEEIFFIVSSKGLVTGGSSKGFVYIPSNPEKMNIMIMDSDGGTRYHKIMDKWYILLEISH